MSGQHRTGREAGAVRAARSPPGTDGTAAGERQLARGKAPTGIAAAAAAALAKPRQALAPPRLLSTGRRRTPVGYKERTQ